MRPTWPDLPKSSGESGGRQKNLSIVNLSLARSYVTALQSSGKYRPTALANTFRMYILASVFPAFSPARRRARAPPVAREPPCPALEANRRGVLQHWKHLHVSRRGNTRLPATWTEKGRCFGPVAELVEQLRNDCLEIPFGLQQVRVLPGPLAGRCHRPFYNTSRKHAGVGGPPDEYGPVAELVYAAAFGWLPDGITQNR